MDEDEPPPSRRPGARRRGRRRTAAAVFGDERRIGLWILPLMLIVGLAGAVLAAAVTVLVYSQRVQSLRDEVGGAAAAADEATSEIATLVEQARADLGLLDEDGADDPDRPAPADPTDRVFAVAVQTAPGTTAVGAAFPFFSDDAETFLVTAAAVVGTAGSAEVYLPSGIVEATVAGVDADTGLAVLRLDVGQIAPLPWRPPDQPMALDDPVRAQGVGGPDTPVVIEGRVAGVGQDALVVDMAVVDYLRGAPLLDPSGQVVAVVTADYRPYGTVGGSLLYLPPVRALCLQLVQCAPEDLGGLPPLPPVATPVPAPIPTGGGTGTTGSPPPPAPPPPPPPPAAPTQPATPPPVPDGQPTTAEPTPPAQPTPTGEADASPTPTG